MIRLVRWRKNRAEVDEREKMARLEEAEREVQDLQDRGYRAIHTLDNRHARNHWRESVERLIQGA